MLNIMKFCLAAKNLVLSLFLIFWIISNFDSGNYIKAQSLDEIVAKFEKRSYTFQSTTLPYRLFIPENYNPAESYPLVLCLHGSGERGTDNELHIRLHRLATSWADTINQNRWPCFVVAPQCPSDKWWVNVDSITGICNIDLYPITNELLTVNNLLDSLIKVFNIDQNRLYITGLSMGGYATWDMIARYPDKFAAAIPMSGGGDSSKVYLFKDVPVWNFHGKLDDVVSVKFSRAMNEAYSRTGIYVVQAANITESVLDIFLSTGAKHLYTEYPNGRHVIWAESYDYPKLFPWVFSQSKSGAVRIEEEKFTTPNSFKLNQNYPNPFNPSTKIKYSIPSVASDFSLSNATLKIYDILGREIATLVNQTQKPGSYEVEWNAENLSSGVYFYQLRAGSYSDTKKMILIR